MLFSLSLTGGIREIEGFAMHIYVSIKMKAFCSWHIYATPAQDELKEIKSLQRFLKNVTEISIQTDFL